MKARVKLRGHRPKTPPSWVPVRGWEVLDSGVLLIQEEHTKHNGDEKITEEVERIISPTVWIEIEVDWKAR